MRSLLPIFLLSIAQLQAQEPIGEQGAFITVSSPKTDYLVQEIIPLRITIGVEEKFLQENLIQPFRQRLDLPLRLEASCLQELAGSEVLPQTTPADRSALQSLVLNGALGQARRVDDRRIENAVFRVFEIDARLLAQESGKLEIPAASIQVAYATSFREDFLNGRVPQDRQQFVLSSQATSLNISDWPEEGRPPAFIGAVGQFRIRAEATVDSPRIGEPFELNLHIEGRGNLHSIPLPRLDDLPGFHVIGRLESSSPEGRSIRYEMAGLSSSISQIPPISFAYLDPDPSPKYQLIQTAAIPIRLRPMADGTSFITPPDQDSELIDLSGDLPLVENPPAGESAAIPPPPLLIEDIADIRPIDASRSHSPWQPLPYAFLAFALLLPLVLTAATLFILHRNEQRRLQALMPEPNRAARDFRKRMGEGSPDMSQAFAEFIAGRLECKLAAVIRPKLAIRLQEAGIPTDLAARSESLLEAMVDRRCDGSQSSNGIDVSQAPHLVEALEARFLQLEEGR